MSGQSVCVPSPAATCQWMGTPLQLQLRQVWVNEGITVATAVPD